MAREDGENDRATAIEEIDGGREGESERAREGERETVREDSDVGRDSERDGMCERERERAMVRKRWRKRKDGKKGQRERMRNDRERKGMSLGSRDHIKAALCQLQWL